MTFILLVQSAEHVRTWRDLARARKKFGVAGRAHLILSGAPVSFPIMILRFDWVEFWGAILSAVNFLVHAVATPCTC